MGTAGTSLTLLCLLICVTGGVALRCYTCWTKDNNLCEPDVLEGSPLLTECSAKQNVCKKIVTKAYRVIKRGTSANYEIISNLTSRLCGQADWRGCFEMRGASSVTVQCACDEHGCNAAPPSSLGGRHVVTMAVAGLLALGIARFLQ